MPYSDVCKKGVCVFVYVIVDIYVYVCVCVSIYTTLLAEYQWNCLVVYLYIQLVILIGYIHLLCLPVCFLVFLSFKCRPA